MEFSGERLKLARESLGLSKEKAANALGVSIVTITRWEREETRPSVVYPGSIATFMKLASYVDTPTKIQMRNKIAVLQKELDLLQSRINSMREVLED